MRAAVVEAEGAGGVAGGAGERLLGRSGGRGCRPCSSRAAARSSARCRGCSRWRRPSARRRRASAAIGGSLRLAQGVEGAGEDDRDGAGARPSRATPASSRYSRWSAERAPNLAASAAPPRLESCSAWSLTGRPRSRAAAKTRATWAGEKAMPSQKASTASTRPSARAARSVGMTDVVEVGVGGPCPRRHGVGAEEGGADAHRALAGERAGGAEHLQLGVAVEAVAGLDLDGGDALGEQRVEARQGGGERARPRSAARVARTVDRMPPPARAISS